MTVGDTQTRAWPCASPSKGVHRALCIRKTTVKNANGQGLLYLLSFINMKCIKYTQWRGHVCLHLSYPRQINGFQNSSVHNACAKSCQTNFLLVLCWYREGHSKSNLKERDLWDDPEQDG
jgi:hypothetical protein